MNSRAGYLQAPRKNNMHCSMNRRVLAPGSGPWGHAGLLGRVLGNSAFLERNLPRARQRVCVFSLEKIDELLANLAAQIEGLASRSRAHEATQLYCAFLEIRHL